MKLYKAIISKITAIQNCLKSENVICFDCHERKLDELIKLLPHGSGFDGETELVIDKCTDNRIVIKTEYHHLNEAGYYTAWTDHLIIVKPSLQFDFTVTVTGRNKNDIKSYIADCYCEVLDNEVTE